MGRRSSSNGRRVGFWAALAAALLFLIGASALAAGRDFEHPTSTDSAQKFEAVGNPQREDTPNDPEYDRAEPDDEDGVSSSNIFDEQFGFFGFPAASTRTSAVYHEGPNQGKPM